MSDAPVAPAVSSSVVNASKTREIAHRTGLLSAPLYRSDDSPFGFPVEDEDEQRALDTAFASGMDDWTSAILSEDDVRASVYLQFARLMPKLPGLVPLWHEPDQAQFAWRHAIMVLSGAGSVIGAHAATILTSLYPQCPLTTDSTVAEWRNIVAESHRVSGWPCTITTVNWASLCASIQQTKKGAPIELWHRVVALFHILKHLRYSRVYGLVATYRGCAASFEFDESKSNMLGTNRFAKTNVIRVLSCPVAEDAKSVHPLTAAIEGWFNVLSTHDLLRREAVTTLPGQVQHGPWSTTCPDPVNNEGFVQHGLRLSGVWLANRGKIGETTGDTSDIISYDWPLNPHHYTVERRLFEYSLPKTYDAKALPFDIFQDAFPNLNIDNFNGDSKSAACLFDALICSSLIRNEVPALSVEFPLIMCMPSTPTLDESTNQGKSKAAHMIARSFGSGIELTGVSDTDSAPDQRILASKIKRFGTLCIDEWRPPKKKSHLLSHENLQLMCTGGAVASGEVLENAPESTHLMHSLVVSCKALDAPPDIVNRAFVLLFDQLTDEQRARGEVLDELQSGKLPLRMRLAALALCEKHRLAEQLNEMNKGGSVKGWRFTALRGLALTLWKIRYGTDGAAAVDTAINTMQARMGHHTRDADENGLLTSLEEGSHIKLRLYSMFHEMTTADFATFLAACEGRDPESKDKGWGPAVLLRARAEMLGIGQRPLSQLCEHLCGLRARASDRSVAIALARDIKALMPDPGTSWTLPDTLGLQGWHITRQSDNNSTPRVRFARGYSV